MNVYYHYYIEDLNGGKADGIASMTGEVKTKEDYDDLKIAIKKQHGFDVGILKSLTIIGKDT